MPGRPALLVCVVLAAVAAGCRERARPWEEGFEPTSGAKPAPPPDGGAPGSASPPPAPTGTGSLLADAGTILLSADDAGPPPPPVRVGGPWVRCYGNFRPAGEPLKDVTRVSLLCGPENGMSRATKAPALSGSASGPWLEGEVGEGQPAATSTFTAVRGECYRIFAVAAPSVADLDVVVRSSRGAAIAADHGEDNWPVVQPDRPFCALEDDTWSIEVLARRGAGRFAAEIWRLPAPSAGQP